MKNLDYCVCVFDAGKKGYSVGMYSEGGAVFDSQSFEPTFPRVINKLVGLADLYPEAFHNIGIFISPEKDRFWEEKETLEKFQKLVYHHYQESLSRICP